MDGDDTKVKKYPTSFYKALIIVQFGSGQIYGNYSESLLWIVCRYTRVNLERKELSVLVCKYRER